MPNVQRIRWLTVAYATTLVLLIAVANRGVLSTSWLAAVPFSDKIGHFVLMGFLSYLTNAALGGRQLQWRRLSVLQGSALVVVLVLAEEISQLWIPHRAFELADLAADVAGISTADLVIRFQRSNGCSGFPKHLNNLTS